ncbi:MAG: hypothetical protein ABIG93_02310 [archaeon]
MKKLFFAPRNKKLGDFDMIEKDGKLYCIFIEKKKSKTGGELEKGNNYSLAVSEDGIHWQDLERLNLPRNEWNNGSLWAQQIYPEKGQNGKIVYYLFYSAVKRLDGYHHSSQQVGIFESEDLINWREIEQNNVDGASKTTTKPIITNQHTGKYYYPSDFHRFCWRDPEVFKVEDQYYCLLVAKDKNKAFEHSGCVALLKSKDKLHWQTMAPLFSPNRYWEIETPHLYKLGLNGKKRYYLVYGTYENEYSVSFAVSDKLFGPYQEPEHNIITPHYCYAERIIDFKGKKLFYYWLRDKFKGKMFTCLAPPKIVEIKNNFMFLKKHPEFDNDFKTISNSRTIKDLNNDERIKSVNNLPLRFEITVNTENPEYRRKIFFDQTKEGLALRDFDFDNRVNDLRTLPIQLIKTVKDKVKLEIYIEDKFCEIYLNDYLVHSFVVEEKASNVKSITIKK